jgi:hypothetical protein
MIYVDVDDVCGQTIFMFSSQDRVGTIPGWLATQVIVSIAAFSK